MLTSNKICKAIKERFGYDVELDRINGIWYWFGDITDDFEEKCTHMTKLNDFTLEQWINDFEYNLNQKKANYYMVS